MLFLRIYPTTEVALFGKINYGWRGLPRPRYYIQGIGAIDCFSHFSLIIFRYLPEQSQCTGVDRVALLVSSRPSFGAGKSEKGGGGQHPARQLRCLENVWIISVAGTTHFTLNLTARKKMKNETRSTISWPRYDTVKYTNEWYSDTCWGRGTYTTKFVAELAHSRSSILC